ncbi:hypothetical protein EKO04_011463 [Ascochyta lentis]|uniref:Zn(2)-C6 fungal-type domain-containing protein n=1 Tax=Ascochyta lentis TaxID=205686 RepID=A0A8H7IS72_9PLEO|nr:hypothetical protein EKO04_011463 [Ascochyta lentis]
MEPSIPASTEGAESPVNARPKRSRAGCLTCRTRRRKCDEGKPICQNCISKGFQCQYAAAFQILGKHNFTPAVKTDVKYATVRFAGDEVDDSSEATPGKTKQPAITAGNQHCSSSAQTNSIIPFKARTATNLANATEQSFSNRTSSLNSYEFALHGLLALGSTSGAAVTSPPLAPVVAEEQAVSIYDFATNDRTNSALDSSTVQIRSDMHRTEIERQSTQSFSTISPSTPNFSPRFENFEGCESLARAYEISNSDPSIPARTHVTDTVAATRGLELLKLYRYQIAPWLDICDNDQHFGVILLVNSTQTPRLRSSIMRLAAASSSKALVSDGMSVDTSLSIKDVGINAASDAAVETVVDVLDVLANAVPNLAFFWRREDREKSRTRLLEKLLLELGSSGLNTCAYWLLVRLGKSHFPQFRRNALLTRSGTDDLKAQCVYDAIALCVDSAMFAQGDDDQWLQRRYGINRVEVWKALVQAFAHWYMHRSQAFQPIIELYSKDGVLADDDYPTIVFTSGAALLANQLYHTGMLLLLQNKPRFADKPSQNSPSMSMLWHAHRICGIAIQNDRPDWWDPCLVASFVVAGRTATHASQHKVIVSTLESVKRLTGWVVDPYVDQLLSEWQLADGW